MTAAEQSTIFNTPAGLVISMVMLLFMVAIVLGGIKVSGKFRGLEGSIEPMGKQLNGRKEQDPTISADITLIRKLVLKLQFEMDEQRLRSESIHAATVATQGEVKGLNQALVGYVGRAATVEFQVAQMQGTVDGLTRRAQSQMEQDVDH